MSDKAALEATEEGNAAGDERYTQVAQRADDKHDKAAKVQSTHERRLEEVNVSRWVTMR